MTEYRQHEKRLETQGVTLADWLDADEATREMWLVYVKQVEERRR